MSMLHVFSHGGSSYIYDGESMLVARCSHEVALEVIKRDSSGDKIVNFNERDLIYAEKDLGRSVESPADEDAHYSLDSDGSDEGKMPRGSIVAIQLLIMGSCNLACSYCYASRGEFSNPSPGRRFMSTDTVYKAMKFAMRNAAPAITVSLLGGEPLLHPNFVEIVEAVYEGVPSNVSISVSVSTNGTVFRSDISECLKKFSVKVSVSVDGSQEAHDSQRRYASNSGSFSIVSSNLRRFWDELGPEFVSVRATCTPQNLKSLPEFIDDLSREFPGMKVELSPVIVGPEHPMYMSLPTIEEFNSLQKQRLNDELRRHGTPDGIVREEARIRMERERLFHRRRLLSKCEIGVNLLTITADGDIYPCVGLLQDDTYRMGNIEEDEMSQSDALRSLYRQNNVLRRRECTLCWAKYLCGGGCVAVNKTVTGDPLICSREMCEMFRSAAEMSLVGFVALHSVSHDCAGDSAVTTALEKVGARKESTPCHRRKKK